MKLQDAVAPFIQDIVGRQLLKNQAQALGIFVACALTLGRSILTDLAVEVQRQGYAKTVKAALKRVDRWINNPRIHISQAMEPLVQRLLQKRRKKLILSLDWVDIRGFACLAAATSLKGRAVWLMWKSLPKDGLNLHMNRVEEEVLCALRSMIPNSLGVIILADRGFHKSRMFTACQLRGFDYVIRIKGDYHVQSRRYQGLLSKLPLKPGTSRFWSQVFCGLKPRVKQNVVIYYRQNLPDRRDGPWFLATSLKGRPEQIVKLYARRMDIEECFRDKKSVNNGWGLRHMRIHTAEGLDHLLLILALAYLILCGLGLYALGHLQPRLWCANNRAGECSLFTIGRRLLGQLQVTIKQLFTEIELCSKSLTPRWG